MCRRSCGVERLHVFRVRVSSETGERCVAKCVVQAVRQRPSSFLREREFFAFLPLVVTVMTSRLHSLGTTAVLASLLAACERPDVPTAPGETPQPSVRAATLFRLPTVRDELLALESELPTFGGIWLGQDGNVHARMVDTISIRRGTGVERLAVFARAHGLANAKAAEVRIHQARFSYRTLDSTMYTLAATVWRDANPLGYGINDIEGTIHVTASSASAAERIRARTPASLRDLLVVDLSPSIQGLQANLHARSRPLDNGFQISSSPNAPPLGTCTAGYMVYLPVPTQGGTPEPSLGRFMLTASHCGTPGAVDINAYRQPGTLGAGEIGREAFDARIYQGTGGAVVTCPGSGISCTCFANEQCTDADVSMIRLDDSVSFWYGWQTTARDTPNGTVAPDNVGFQPLRQLATSPLAGMTIFKTGQRTGTSFATVTSMCFKMTSSSFPASQLCQVEATGRAGGGDSGSPVFYRDGSNQPVALGILHSGADETSTFPPSGLFRRFYFAPWGRIQSALGVSPVFF